MTTLHSVVPHLTHGYYFYFLEIAESDLSALYSATNLQSLNLKTSGFIIIIIQLYAINL